MHRADGRCADLQRTLRPGAAPVYGCVTNGEAWQFLRLVDQIAAIDVRRYYIDNVGGILAVFRWIVGHGGAEPSFEPPAPGPAVEVPVPV